MPIREKHKLVSTSTDCITDFAVVWIVMSSTTVVFALKNMSATMMVLLGFAVFIGFRNGTITLKNLRITGIIFLIGMVNFAANYRFYEAGADIIILLIRLVSCTVIASAIERDRFIKIYVLVMKWMAIVSVICFAAVFAGATLPLQVAEQINGITYFYTPYYVLGFGGIQYRNCGMFWEPGGYQIYLNLALLFVICRPELFCKQKKELIKYIILFSVTILTTLSTTGFLCFAVVLAIGVLNSNHDRKLKRNLMFIIVLAAIGLALVESNLGIIENKLINGEGSFSTRSNDTQVTFELALTRPVFGYGFTNGYMPRYLTAKGVEGNSNGIGAFMCAMGIPTTILYLGQMLKQLRALLKTNTASTCLILGLLLLFFMSESVMIVTIFVFLLYAPVERNSNICEE